MKHLRLLALLVVAFSFAVAHTEDELINKEKFEFTDKKIDREIEKIKGRAAHLAPLIKNKTEALQKAREANGCAHESTKLNALQIDSEADSDLQALRKKLGEPTSRPTSKVTVQKCNPHASAIQKAHRELSDALKKVAYLEIARLWFAHLKVRDKLSEKEASESLQLSLDKMLALKLYAELDDSVKREIRNSMDKFRRAARDSKTKAEAGLTVCTGKCEGIFTGLEELASKLKKD